MKKRSQSEIAERAYSICRASAVRIAVNGDEWEVDEEACFEAAS